jgi:hypothetical protein
MAHMVVKKGEKGVVGIVILCAVVIGLVSYGFADDIFRFVAERLRSIPYSQVLGRITSTIVSVFTYIKALIVSYIP